MNILIPDNMNTLKKEQDELVSNFKQFLVRNGVISTAASITIGFATATFVKSFVADVVMPIVFMILVNGAGKVNKATGTFFERFLEHKNFKFTNFVSELITWILIIFAAFLVLDLVVRKTLGNAVTNAPAPPVFGPPAPAVQIPAVVTVPVVSAKPPAPNAGNASVLPVPQVGAAVKEEYVSGMSSFDFKYATPF